MLNGKIYVGKHQTEDLQDSYAGSSRVLDAAVEKYGKESFVKTILFVFETEDEMNAKEAELVTEEFCSRKDTYNICPGGKGGWGYVNTLHSVNESRRLGGKRSYALGKLAEAGKKNAFLSGSERTKFLSEKGNRAKRIKGTSEETRRKMSLNQTLNNSMKNRCWIRKDDVMKVIHESEIDRHKEEGWSLCRELHIKPTLWITREGVNKLVKRDQLQEYLSDNWKEGRQNKSK